MHTGLTPKILPNNMSVLNKDVINEVGNSIRGLENYYKDIRALFEFVEIRFKLDEYGVKLKTITGNKLMSNASGFKLSDDSDYPFYLWIPSWLGRFYCVPTGLNAEIPLPKTKLTEVKIISFIWIWNGFGDAYVEDKNESECWIGVAEPISDNPENTVEEVADTIFKQFRVERNSIEKQSDGWINGEFHPNSIGCNLSGKWYLKRIPLANLLTFYEIEQSIVRSIGEKHNELLSIHKVK